VSSSTSGAGPRPTTIPTTPSATAGARDQGGGGVGVWALGARTILKERERDAAGRPAYEARNLAFARWHTSAAVPEVLARWTEEEEEEEAAVVVKEEQTEGDMREADSAEGIVKEEEEEEAAAQEPQGAEEAQRCLGTGRRRRGGGGGPSAPRQDGQRQGLPGSGSGTGPGFNAHAADGTTPRRRKRGEKQKQQRSAPAAPAAFLLTSRLPGAPLSSAWDDLSAEARARIATRVAAHLRDELHAVTSMVVSTGAARRGLRPARVGARQGTGPPARMEEFMATTAWRAACRVWMAARC
jgi:hypothetical protein